MSIDKLDDDVIKSLSKRGEMSKAPKNSCGCDHHSMSKMSTLDYSHMVAYVGTVENPGILRGFTVHTKAVHTALFPYKHGQETQL